MPNSQLWSDQFVPLTDLDNAAMASDTAAVIADKETMFYAKRLGSTIFTGRPNGLAQKVRIESLGDPASVIGTIATADRQYVLIHGYRGHPTIPDTDLMRGDTDLIDGYRYSIIDYKVNTRSSLQCIAEVQRL